MADHNPTVIPRMANAYFDEWKRIWRHPKAVWPNRDDISDENARQLSMLAAVRELRNWTGDLHHISAQFQPIKFKDGHSAYVGDVIEKFVEFVIADYQRRSAAKGE